MPEPPTKSYNPDADDPEHRRHDEGRKGEPKEPEPIRSPAEANLLRQAYVALAKADHDYDGHRLKAMGRTAEAARLLGESLAGDGRAMEAQKSSDDELREASSILKRAQSMAASNHHHKVAEYINAAVWQISIALNIR
jgi:hypothetical protein